MPSGRLVARDVEQQLELRVPGLHAALQVDDQDADRQGLDDVLVVVLELLVLRRLAAQGAVEARVLERDRERPGHSLHQRQVVAGKQAVPAGPAQADPGQGASAQPAGDEMAAAEARDRRQLLVRLGIRQQDRATVRLRAQVERIQLQRFRGHLAIRAALVQRAKQLPFLVALRRLGQDEHSLHAQGLGEARSDAANHAVEVRLGSQFRRERRQGPAIVVTVAVETPLEDLEQEVADGPDQGGRGRDRNHPGHRSEAIQPGGWRASPEQDSVTDRGQQPYARSVGRGPAPEDLDVQEAIAQQGRHDRGRQRREGEDGEGLVRAWRGPCRERRHIQRSERQRRREGAADQPIPLEPVQGVARMAGALVDRVGGRADIQDQQDEGGRVEERQQGGFADAVGGPAPCRRVMGRAHRDRGSEGQPGKPGPPGLRSGETQAEVQEQRWHQQQRPDVQPVDQPVETVQLAGGTERIHAEGRYAESEEAVRRRVRGSPEPDEQADQAVDPAQRQQEAAQGAPSPACEHERKAEPFPAPFEEILDALPGSDPRAAARRVQRFRDRETADRMQKVARPHPH